MVYSPDKERLAAFYERLGLSFIQHRHGSDTEHHAAELGGTVFEIYPAKEGDVPTKIRLGFQVESVDMLVRGLEANGVTIVSVPKDSEWGRRAVVADPDGNRVELTEISGKE